MSNRYAIQFTSECLLMNMSRSLSEKVKIGLIFGGLGLLFEEKQRIKQRRRKWIKNWLKQRQHYSHMKLLKELENHEPQDLKNYLRMSKQTFDKLLSLIRNRITKQDTLMRSAITPEERLVATLRFLATGRSYEDLKFSSAISPQALGHIIPETCLAIFCCLKDEYLKFPKTEDDWRDIADDFWKVWQFKNCIGAMDGKHVQIKKPYNSGSFYYNYKGTYSIVLFAVVNAKCEFLYIHTGTNGRVSDGGILKHTTFYQKLKNKTLCIPSPCKLENNGPQVPFVFVGDDAFGLEENIMKPYSLRGISKEDRIYNYRLCRARRVVENAFGILSSRFRVLLTPINLRVENVDAIVLACCALHNFMMKERGRQYSPENYTDHEDTDVGKVIAGEWHDVGELMDLAHQPPLNSTFEAKTVRENYKNYFNGVGKIPFQEKMITNNVFK